MHRKSLEQHMTHNKCFINASDDDDGKNDGIPQFFNKYLLGAYAYITAQIFHNGLCYM